MTKPMPNKDADPDNFMPDTRMFLQRLVAQDTIMQQTAEAILMCVDRDVARALQRLEIATVERLEAAYKKSKIQ